MPTLFQKIVRFFFGTKKRIVQQIDPESVRTNQTIRSLSYENAELKAILSKIQQQRGIERQSDRDKEEEEKVKKALYDEKKQLKEKVEGLSLKGLFTHLEKWKNRELKEKLSFWTFNRSKKIAPFGDIIFSKEGDIVLMDKKGNSVFRADNIKDIFFDFPALVSDAISGRIPISLDEEGKWVENIVEYQINEIIESGDKLKFARARKAPVYKIINALNEQISEKNEQLAESEAVNKSLVSENNSLKSQIKVYEKSAETSKSELNLIKKQGSDMEMNYGNLKRDYQQALKTNEIYEDANKKLEREIEKMRKQAERKGMMLSDEKALEIIKSAETRITNLKLPQEKEEKQKEVGGEIV